MEEEGGLRQAIARLEQGGPEEGVQVALQVEQMAQQILPEEEGELQQGALLETAVLA
jgi:hypothetical protein